MPAQPPETRVLDLPTGRLEVEAIAQPGWSLDALTDFAARINPRRGFLFVSRVLGRHIGVRPSDAQRAWQALVAQMPEPEAGPIAVVAMAETAIALGHGVYRAMCERWPARTILFVHSTRYRFDRPLLCAFSEDHSHASAHLIYAPADPQTAAQLAHARTLVLVDDELTTGQTLHNLHLALRPALPALTQAWAVALTDWSGGKSAFEGPVVSLLQGVRRFEPRADFVVPPMPDVTSAPTPRDHLLPRNDGRFWLSSPLSPAAHPALDALKPGDRVAIVGTGEFVTLPFLVAEALEARGVQTWCHATTRSPAFITHAMQSVAFTRDGSGDDFDMRIYNLAEGGYDRIVVCYETPSVPADAHRLGELKVLPLAFGATP
jgi:hypothetical protein